MALTDIVNSSIAVAKNNPAGPSFSIPLIASYHTVYADRVRYYTSLTGLTADGFSVSSATYKAASALLSAYPRIGRFGVGRRALAFTQTYTVTVQTAGAATGVLYKFAVGGSAVTYTVPGSSTVTSVGTALASAINAAYGSSIAGSSSGVITITAAAGVLIDLDFTNMTSPYRTFLSVADTTADPGIATDLAAIRAADASWYGFCLDSNGTAEIAASLAWAEANGVAFYANTMDTLCATTTTTSGNVMATAKAAAYARSMLLFSGTKLLSYSGAAMMGNQFAFAPGQATNAFKTLPQVPVDTLTETEWLNINTNGGNSYSSQTGGSGYTYNGITPSGEFFDIVRGLDWTNSQIQLGLLYLMANAPKVSFDDPGIARVESTIRGILKTASKAPYNILATSPAFTVTVPTAASVDSTNKGNRNLPNVSWTGVLAGAIQGVVVNGTVTF